MDPEKKGNRRWFLKKTATLLGAGGLAALGFSGAPGERVGAGGNPLEKTLRGFLEGKDPKEYGPEIAKFLLDQGIAFAKAIEILRKGGGQIASSAEPNATFYIAPPSGPNGDTLSMGFRTDSNADWVTVYAANGPAGSWFQFVQIKHDRDAAGKPTGAGVNITPLFQYGTRGDGFDINPKVGP